jgi:hypothetical protein
MDRDGLGVKCTISNVLIPGRHRTGKGCVEVAQLIQILL